MPSSRPCRKSASSAGRGVSFGGRWGRRSGNAPPAGRGGSSAVPVGASGSIRALSSAVRSASKCASNTVPPVFSIAPPGSHRPIRPVTVDCGRPSERRSDVRIFETSEKDCAPDASPRRPAPGPGGQERGAAGRGHRRSRQRPPGAGRKAAAVAGVTSARPAAGRVDGGKQGHVQGVRDPVGSERRPPGCTGLRARWFNFCLRAGTTRSAAPRSQIRLGAGTSAVRVSVLAVGTSRRARGRCCCRRTGWQAGLCSRIAAKHVTIGTRVVVQSPLWQRRGRRRPASRFRKCCLTARCRETRAGSIAQRAASPGRLRRPPHKYGAGAMVGPNSASASPAESPLSGPGAVDATARAHPSVREGRDRW